MITHATRPALRGIRRNSTLAQRLDFPVFEPKLPEPYPLFPTICAIAALTGASIALILLLFP